ncbi:MAG: YceI family protein [Flavobacteriales bacterium]|nr:YceI family protein [Flavobacteriales bacterium]
MGSISLKSAEFLVNDNLLTNASVEIDMSTLRVDNFGEDTASQNQLTGHLVSADFFDVPNHPTSSFELTGIESIEGDFNSTLTGNLTIMNISKSISFKANVDVSDNEVSMKSEKFILDRTDWELVYNIEGSEGVPIDYIISNDLEFTIDVTVSK